ncbi:MAG: PEP-CTERM sorting domain-containing protein [Armatimonadota bacterium]
MKKLTVIFVMLAALLLAVTAHAVQFDYLAPGYTQQIFVGPLTGAPGMVWTSGGNLLIKDGVNILEYSLTTTVYNGTNVHPVAVTHNIPGLLSGTNSGAGMTKGLDGFIYVPTGLGLQRFSTTLTGSAQFLAGTVAGPGYGVTTLPDGRIAYVAGWGTNEVYVYDPVGATNTLIYTAPSLIDDIEASVTGAIALARQTVNNITIISNSGSVINAFSTLSHHPDGLAFGNGATSTALYSNNNDGSISQYVLGAGYLGAPVVTDIALQTLPSGKAYGDLAAVGPDCAFYVSQFDNNGYNGCTPGVGTHWDNGTTTNQASIIRIAAIGPDGNEICGFGSATETVPEPGSLLAVGAGLLGLFSGLPRRRK